MKHPKAEIFLVDFYFVQANEIALQLRTLCEIVKSALSLHKRLAYQIRSCVEEATLFNQKPQIGMDRFSKSNLVDRHQYYDYRTYQIVQKDKLDFLHFIFKIAQCRISLNTLDPLFGKYLYRFRNSLINQIIHRTQIKQFNFSQLSVILYSLHRLREPLERLNPVMNAVQKNIPNANDCVPFHLILIIKTLKFIQIEAQKASCDKVQLEEMKKGIASMIASKVPVILEYNSLLQLMQLYNSISSYHPELAESILKRVQQLLSKLQIKTINPSFHKQDLAEFSKNMQEISDKNQAGKQILRVIKGILASKSESQISEETSKLEYIQENIQ